MYPMSKNLSTDPYKGVRDFYPEDMAIQNQIFDIWKSNVQKYGYSEYNASVIEPSELYIEKSGQEIVEKQTYTFTDRGGRDITLRPEMTPTVARMVAGRKRELAYPLRWFSIPNLFRYEQPQRGRLREHWQLNVDIFGVEGLEAEIEIIQIAYDITKSYGLNPDNFEILINNRKLMNYVSKEVFNLSEEEAYIVSKLIDKKNKITPDAFINNIKEILKDNSEKFLTLLNSQNFEEFTVNLRQTENEHIGLKEIRFVLEGLEKLGITNVRFDQTLMRGFDYYTGIVFEVFDKNPINRRSVFGGGRYDDLLSLFGGDKVPAVGFGAGDVVARDLMETYGKIQQDNTTASAQIYLCVMNKQYSDYARDVAQSLREKGINVSIDYSYRKIGDQIKNADKNNIPRIICIGEEEVNTGNLKVKNLKTGSEKTYTLENIVLE